MAMITRPRPLATITEGGKVTRVLDLKDMTREEQRKFMAFAQDYERVLEQKRSQDTERAVKQAEQRALWERERRNKPWLR